MYNAASRPVSHNYTSLPASVYGEVFEPLQNVPVRSSNKWKILALIEALIILVGLVFLFIEIESENYPTFIHPIIPRRVVQRKTIVFNKSLSYNPSPYQGNPSPVLDARWESTYSSGMFRVTGQEQASLKNRTARLPDDPDGYIITLTVFHSLHCLNYLRKTLYPAYYPDFKPVVGDNTTVRDHAAHCIDLLRQSSMCTPDTTPIVWQWDTELNKHMAAWDVSHSCLDYEMFHSWVSSRALQEYNASVWVEGNPVYGFP